MPRLHYNRGEAWLRLGEWEKAREDLSIARDKGVDIITGFHNDYISVKDFRGETWRESARGHRRNVDKLTCTLDDENRTQRRSCN